jgi:hypothetical protein
VSGIADGNAHEAVRFRGPRRRDAPRLIAGQALHIAAAGLILVVEVAEDLIFGVFQTEGFAALVHGPGRREAGVRGPGSWQSQWSPSADTARHGKRAY